MNLKQALLVLITLCASASGAQPSTHSEFCAKFSSAVIPIKSVRGNGTSMGTGFIVSPDGWIITAAHVVIDPDTKQVDSLIQTILPGSSSPATVTLESPNDDFTRIHDFALLKAEGKDLPFLTLGSEEHLRIGSDATIIGFPFSALSGAPVRFCLSASIAGGAPFTTPVGKLDIIFLQGPSVEGISGSPLISEETGEVVGIVTLKLTGITAALREQKRAADAFEKQGSAIFMGRMNVSETISGLIDVLEKQLANGLGAATGAKDAADRLAEAQKKAATDNVK